MAKLRNENGTLLFELNLYPDQKSDDWIKYGIVIGPNKENKELSLTVLGRELCKIPSLRLSGSELYFEADYEPEVLVLCSGVLEVLDKKTSSFFFEPVDQEDFQLEIRKTRRGGFSINIYSNNFAPLEGYSWPIYSYIGVKMVVKEDDVRAFIKQLKDEYIEIEGRFSVKTFFPKIKK